MFILDATQLPSLTHYLRKQGWLQRGEKIRDASKPGDGNMNYVLRVSKVEGGSFIVKQSRAFVEKYPQIPAPADRTLVEGAFYEKIKSDRFLRKFMPKLIGIDSINNVIALEDLGLTRDYTHVYGMKSTLLPAEIQSLTQYLSQLHQSFHEPQSDDEFLNSKMRQLNHQHIFLYPFMVDNGFDLDSVQIGLQEIAMSYKRDEDLKNKIDAAGEIYLSRGNHLLHGDYYPGSWLRSADGLKVIDPEFCFYGPVEFDLGVMMAHLIMTQHEQVLVESIMDLYQSKQILNNSLLSTFIGIEIMRRLIGLAQLPLVMTVSAKNELLQQA